MTDLEAELDRLYALPLAEFIARRNALAKRLRAGGESRQADEVRALAKPALTAWAVNALYHHERERFDTLLQAAAAVRAALAGEGDRREAETARRQALTALLGRAAKLLAAAGHAATSANRQRISHTLEALAARDPADDGPRLGRLTADLKPRGFDVLAGLAASLPPPAPSAAASAPPRRRRSEKARTAGGAARSDGDERARQARREVAEREDALAELDLAAREAEATAEAALERHDRLTAEAAEAERLARAAREALVAAKADLAAARKAASAARKSRRDARARLATARRRLERLAG